MKVCGKGYSFNLVNCSSLTTVRRFLLTIVLWILIFDTRFCCTAENRLVNDRNWNRQTTSHFRPCRSCSNSIKVAWRVQLRCHAVFMTSSPSSSLRFSLLAVILRTTLNKITSRQFQQHLQKAPLCSGIRLHLFTFTYSPAFAIP